MVGLRALLATVHSLLAFWEWQTYLGMIRLEGIYSPEILAIAKYRRPSVSLPIIGTVISAALWGLALWCAFRRDREDGQ